VSGDASRIVLADELRNRVLIYSPLPAAATAAAVVIGQPDFETTTVNRAIVDPFSFNLPSGIATNGTRLYVADAKNGRVLVWNELPVTSNRGADFVLGQTDPFTAITTGGSSDKRDLRKPRAVAVSGPNLFVSDTENSRILIWNTPPTANYEAAQKVLTGLASGLAYDAATQTLAAADPFNNRVLLWTGLNPATVADNDPFDIVVGQLLAASTTANNPNVPDAGKLNTPIGVAFSGGKLLVADAGNNRVLIWNTIPATNGTGANVVLGTSTAVPVTDTPAVSRSTLGRVAGIQVHEGRLFVVDQSRHRVIFWNTVPTTSGTLPDGVFGQRRFEGENANDGGIGERTLFLANPTNPIGSFGTGSTPNVNPGLMFVGSGLTTKLWVSDSNNSRILRIPFILP
jgi:hypothetical protein